MVGGAGAASLIGWQSDLVLHADELRKNGKACILLWMDGGPSQFETFDPKPGTNTGGSTLAIPTRIPGVHFADSLPHLANSADKLCVFRSMTGKEGEHMRASYIAQTGHLPAAAVKHPALGAHIAMQLGGGEGELPSFVSIGENDETKSKHVAGAGFLSASYAPLYVRSAAQPPENSVVMTSEESFRRRMRVLSGVDREFEVSGGGRAAADHRAAYESAARLLLSPKMSAFDVSKEPFGVRSAYGESEIGMSCLAARRLIEAGVSFVQATLPGWDAHGKCGEKSQELGRPMDQAFAALLRDLEERGRLESTLIVWMGEFGREPKLNDSGGRGHFPRAYSAVLAGCGVRGGQVIGSTGVRGVEVEDRPVTVQDFLRTAMIALGLDPDLEHQTASGRPISTLHGGTTVEEALA